ncbi:MAG: dehydrogenase [Proteobacteria bacterium]|nr:dehydrogenase [Pseudomonadota bacterium]
MPYMLLIVEPRGQRAERGREAGEAVYQRMLDYAQELKERGLLLATSSLKAEGTRLQKRDGRSQVLDGPFTESKEMIGGFFLLDCEDPELALQLAGRCPAAEWATIEVRQTGPCYA